MLMAEYRLVKAEAKMFDGQEGIPDSFEYYTWLDSRY
jgi:hypothetical protein